MDDPWGSPWESSDAMRKHDVLLPPSPPKSLLSPPPRAFFGSTTSLQSHSPWADENGLDDWKGAARLESSGNAVDWGPWGDSAIPAAQLSPALGSSGKASPLAWPSSAATSPGLRPLPRSRASSIFRHHSPDPWVSEVPQADRTSTIASNPPSRSVSPSKPGRTVAEPTIAEQPDGPEETPVLVSVESASSGEAAEALTEHEKETPGTFPSLAGESESSAKVSEPKLAVERFEDQSRPSSTFSADSHHSTERQDSPITSIDEGPKTRLRSASRKLSGKVQELVGIYDGLARARSNESSPHGRREKRDTDPGRFGDFEGAMIPETNEGADSSSARAPAGLSCTPTHPHDDVAGDESNRGSIDDATLSRFQKLTEQFGPVKFGIDLTAIDKLFPELDGTFGDSAIGGGGIPNRIITDSFTSISQRKSWYRISRFGSMRKHNSGDEDNYHSVAWKSSQLHGHTIRIVRRWMEEDSFSGRATLGGSRGMGVFNWNSSTAPVDLNEVFARRTPKAHTRTQSSLSGKVDAHSSASTTDVQPSRHSTTATTSPLGQSSKASGILPPPVADFGWSSSPKVAPNKAGPLPTNGRVAKSLDLPLRDPRPSLGQAPAPIRDEEDEWGEMVSSPTAASHPVAALAAVTATEKADTAPTVSQTIVQPKHTPKGSLDELTSPASIGPGSGPSDPWSFAEFSQLDPLAQASEPPNLPIENDQLPADFSTFEATPQPKHTPNGSLDELTSPASIGPGSEPSDPWSFADFSQLDPSAQTLELPELPKQDDQLPSDFSVFESTKAFSSSTAKAETDAESRVSSNLKPCVGKNKSDDMVSKVASGSTDQPRSPELPRPVKAVLGPMENATGAHDREVIARTIIENLPDLSYMLG
ncbi:hypothetical protein GGR56DRAFT_80634 [Xylariaceae sp. FL0804]|nr:hypothetical protein GGR56DRAFT_80634 [Xylariaceae sp. FL0804]